jgi:hypothetical protein
MTSAGQLPTIIEITTDQTSKIKARSSTEQIPATIVTITTTIKSDPSVPQRELSTLSTYQEDQIRILYQE